MKTGRELIMMALWCISLCVDAQTTTRTSKNYFDNSFRTISQYKVGGSLIALEKKLDMSDYRANGDGNRFYRTTLAITVTTDGQSKRNILDTDLYTTSNFWKAHLPCMMVDPDKKVLYIFANSKASDRYYGMNGYVYRLDQRTERWTRETVFTNANFGWFSFFGGSNSGNPELWHFSYAGYYAMKSTRNSNGLWSINNMGGITPQKADNDYASHENILVTSRSGVDRMATGGSSNGRSSASSNNSIIPGISDKAVATTAAVVGTGAILYGLFKLFTAGGDSSSGSSSSSSSSSDLDSRHEYKGVELVGYTIRPVTDVAHVLLAIRNKNNYDVYVRVQLYQGKWNDARITYSDSYTGYISGIDDDNSTDILVKANSLRKLNLKGKFGGGEPTKFRIKEVF